MTAPDPVVAETCHCGHSYAQHRVSAYGQTCAVPCTGRKDYGEGMEDCSCVRSIPLADVPASVQPFNDSTIHPQRRTDVVTAPDPLAVVIAEAVSQHDFISLAMRCRCGWFYGDGTHAEHVGTVVAAAVRKAGLATPEELTEQTREEAWYHDYRRDKRTMRRFVTPWAAVAEGEQP